MPSDDWDMPSVDKWVHEMNGRTTFAVENLDHEDDPEIVTDAVTDELLSVYEEKRAILGDEIMKNLNPR